MADIPHATLMRDVEHFAKEKDLEDLTELLKRGALVAQNPAQVDHIETLEATEREALQLERDHKWKHPLSLYVTIFICSIGTW